VKGEFCTGIVGAWPRDVLGWRRQLDVDPSGGEEVASGPPQLLGPRWEPSTGRHYQAHRLPSRSSGASSCGGYRSPFDRGPLPLRGLGGAVGAIPASSRAVRPESAHRRCSLCLLHIRQRAEFRRQCGDPRRWELIAIDGAVMTGQLGNPKRRFDEYSSTIFPQ
jgi:hypothetical protein